MNRNRQQSGAANVWLILSITFIVLTVASLAVMVWALLNYFDQKDNVDAKVETAVATAKKEQADADEVKFNQRDKEPNREFVGPDDYGRVTFNYPKTWSVYVSKEESSGTYQAYLNPLTVPPVTTTQQFALRVTIEAKDYDKVIDSFGSLVSKGDLKSSSVKANDQVGTRFDGSFSKDIRGSAVVFKIRDKTVTLRTDADTFKADFDALVTSLKFNS